MKRDFSRNGHAPVDRDELSDEVDAKLDRINELWNRLEHRLLRRQPPRSISVEVFDQRTGEDGDYLERHFMGIQRQNGKWRVCHAVDWSSFDENEPYPASPSKFDWKAISECDLDTRILVAQFVHKLQKEVDDTRKHFIPKLDETISRLEEAVDCI